MKFLANALREVVGTIPDNDTSGEVPFFENAHDRRVAHCLAAGDLIQRMLECIEENKKPGTLPNSVRERLSEFATQMIINQ